MSRASYEDRRQAMRQQILQLVASMKPGECLNIEGRELKEHFPGGYGGMTGSTFKGKPEEEFLSACVGSSDGNVRIRDDNRGWFIISRHMPDVRDDGAVYHVDADRKHLFDKRPDGLWIRNAVPYVRGH